LDEGKVGETMDRVYGERPVNPVTAGKHRYVYRNGEMVEE